MKRLYWERKSISKNAVWKHILKNFVNARKSFFEFGHSFSSYDTERGAISSGLTYFSKYTTGWTKKFTIKELKKMFKILKRVNWLLEQKHRADVEMAKYEWESFLQAR